MPAKRAVLGPLDRIFTRIGASDDLAGGRSTFMLEMTETANILHNATERQPGADGRGRPRHQHLRRPVAGLGLRRATSPRKIRAFTLFATHYFELTSLAGEAPGVANVHVEAVEHGDTLVFLHSVKEGPANQSYGLQVAALAGIPRSVTDEARRYLVELERERDALRDHGVAAGGAAAVLRPRTGARGAGDAAGTRRHIFACGSRGAARPRSQCNEPARGARDLVSAHAARERQCPLASSGRYGSNRPLPRNAAVCRATSGENSMPLCETSG